MIAKRLPPVARGLLDLVRLHGPSCGERPVADRLLEELASLGAECREDGAAAVVGGNAGNVIADLPSSPGSTGPRLLLGAHMDVVPPGWCEEPVVEEGVVRVGSGEVLGADDRAGIAILLEAAREWAGGAPHPPVRFLFTVGEERHLLGVNALEPDAIEGCPLGYVLDSATPLGTLVSRTPTCVQFEARFEGRPAHSGIRPEDGRSAVQMAARAIDRMALGRLDPETTANIGILEGGTAGNVVPPRARLTGESRSFRQERVEEVVASMEAACREAAAHHEGRVEWSERTAFRSYTHGRGDEVVERAWAAARRLGIEPRLGETGGGSDANVLNERGIPCLNLGMGITGNHSPAERVPVADLEGLLRLVLAIAEDAA